MEKSTRKYGLITAICMVVGTVIGSGVFFKAQDVLNKMGGNMPLFTRTELHHTSQRGLKVNSPVPLYSIL